MLLARRTIRSFRFAIVNPSAYSCPRWRGVSCALWRRGGRRLRYAGLPFPQWWCLLRGSGLPFHIRSTPKLRHLSQRVLPCRQCTPSVLAVSPVEIKLHHYPTPRYTLLGRTYAFCRITGKPEVGCPRSLLQTHYKRAPLFGVGCERKQHHLQKGAPLWIVKSISGSTYIKPRSQSQ